MNHEYLIDGEGRRWCADDCPVEAPHWNGEPENVFTPLGDILEGESGSGNARRSEWGYSVPATPLQPIPGGTDDEDDVTWSDLSTPSPEYVVYDDKAHPFTITEEK